MESEPERAIKYLGRAQELRKRARALFDLEAKQALLHEVDDFERMAAEITQNMAAKNSD
jgi:hypothetical protein